MKGTGTPHTYKAVVIGAGSGGLTVALGLAGLGHRVAIIESGPVGGDCTNVGCIPSKTLLHLSKVQQSERNGSDAIGELFKEVRYKRDTLSNEETESLRTNELVEFVQGTAHLHSATEVIAVGPDERRTVLRSDNVIIATGSRPIELPIDGLGPERTLTNETLFELDEAPDHLVIIGGGAIAVEMATAFTRLGSKVTIVELAPEILPREDPGAAQIVHEALNANGIDIRTGVSAQRYDESDRTLYLSAGQITDVDQVLLAVGRRPRLDDLGLDALGIASGRRGIAVDDWGRTSIDGVYAVGDVTGETLTTHGANAVGRRIVQAIGLPWIPKSRKLASIGGAVFADPELASVGCSLDDLSQRWPEKSRLHLRVDLAATDRGLTDDIRFGAVIVDIERFTGKVLRATIVGPGAADAIGIFTLAIDQDISMHKIYKMVHPYPSFASAIGKIADEFTRRTLPRIHLEALAWARYKLSRPFSTTKKAA